MNKKYWKYYILFALIYFGQGVYALPSQAVFYWLKETLGMGVSQIAYITALLTIPWTVKPIYGLISDMFAMPLPYIKIRKKR